MNTALITGASGGIGRATVRKFLSEGYFVVGQYNRSEDKIKEFSEQLGKEGFSGYFLFLKADLSSEAEINRMFGEVSKNFGSISVLVNNAGMGLYKLITETDSSEWDKIFSVNVKSAYLLSNLALKGMIERKSGKIVNVSSVWGQVGASMETAYSASKAALIGYTKALAKEVAPCGINVNCVCPGVIDTPMNSIFSEEEMNDIKNSVPLGRLGSPQDVAELIYFLSSEKASYITGQTVTVDGAYTL